MNVSSSGRTEFQGPPLGFAALLTAMAGGMGWGIRGQYGHETGAMIAGVLVSLVLVFLFCPSISSLSAARIVALTAVGISFGGSMTYGQTVGLTHDGPLIGHWDALRWGLTGLAVKGGIWIGFAGAFLGIGMSPKNYRPLELTLVTLGLVCVLFLGLYLVNQPFQPEDKILPRFYFSDHWIWEPAADLKPRRERWGGLLFALVGLVAYLGLVKRDRLARNLALFGILGGAIGFPAGQGLQAYHAWNREVFQSGWFASLEPYMNWWNVMETVFGAVFGLILAVGVWLNRRELRRGPVEESVEWSSGTEWALLILHAGALAAWNFMTFPVLDRFAGHAITMGLIPIAGIMGGRLWPPMFSLVVVAIPIAGKTLRELSYRHQVTPVAWGWLLYLVLPLTCLTLLSLWFARPRARGAGGGRAFARGSLLAASWFYFWINFAFFRFPWPWAPWTSRTPSAIVFTVCTVAITLACLGYGWEKGGLGRAD